MKETVMGILHDARDLSEYDKFERLKDCCLILEKELLELKFLLSSKITWMLPEVKK